MAALYSWVVSNSKGITGGEVRGTICMKTVTDNNQTKTYLYTFFAVKDESDVEQGSNSINDVHLTMPVGGGQNGLLRLPRVGEKILVAMEGENYYLIAYLPNEEYMEFREESASEKEANEIISSEALTLRYKSPNPFPKDNEGRSKQDISEIKISKQQTYWPNQKKSEKFPYIDRVDVSSAGDVITTAQNYNEVNASRIGLFAGVQDDLSESKNNASVDDGLCDLPLDNKFAGNSFGRGDVQVRADNTIVLRAKNGIQIQCGRSIIKIDDTGISLTSAKIDPAFLCGDDSTISITSLNGVNVTGDSIDLKAKIKYSLSEQLGGSLTSFAGMTRMNTHDYRITTNNIRSYMQNIVSSCLQFVQAEITMGCASAIKNPKNDDQAERVSKLEEFMGSGGIILGNLSSVWDVFGGTIVHDKITTTKRDYVYDMSDYMLSVMDLIFSLRTLAYSLIDAWTPIKKKRDRGIYGDAMSIINLTFDYVLLEVMAIYSYVQVSQCIVKGGSVSHYASMGLNARGFEVEGKKGAAYFVEQNKQEGPFCAAKADNKDKEKVDNKEKNIKGDNKEKDIKNEGINDIQDQDKSKDPQNNNQVNLGEVENKDNNNKNPNDYGIGKEGIGYNEKASLIKQILSNKGSKWSFLGVEMTAVLAAYVGGMIDNNADYLSDFQEL